MPSMSYCRFENTYRDLIECYRNINNNLSDTEHRYREYMIEVCKNILNEYDPESFVEEEFEDEE